MQVVAHGVPARPLAGLRVVVVDDDRVSLLAITAHPSFDSRRDAERAGFGAVFSKPFARDELIDTILRLATSQGSGVLS